ncbi:hypothetical protein MLD38_027490 [Melastoma candidum]|uniref:Uncharacterized protein n=1 Tax=Melastoma candidum TaxID=119954 RepID=A0ACB9P1Y8_9MYRT|nr:hypothetical protein MLD38_027490 [Melastoma candidum]
MNGLGCDNSDDFVIDMESFSHPTCKDVASNPRITLQRSLSRKGSQRGNEEKVIVTSNPADKSDGPCIVASLSPRAPVVGAGVQDPLCMTDHSSKPQSHHQITIITNSGCNDSRFNLRRNSFRRGYSLWAIDPKRVLIIFATLSSMGTILLIYFTLSLSKPAGNGGSFDIQE